MFFGKRSKAFFAILLCLLWVGTLILPVAAATPALQAAAQTAVVLKAGEKCVVTSQSLHLRAKASAQSQSLGLLKKGTVLTVLGKSGKWYRVSTVQGKKGFIYGAYVAPFKTSAPASPATPSAPAAPTADKPSVSQVSLTISAAASLTDALKEIGRIYEEKNPGVKLTFNFGASGSLQQQIEQGAPVDVFLSAATKQMDALEAKGLLAEGTEINLLKNKMVLVVPKDSTAVTGFADLATDKVKVIAIGEPASVPAGKYAQETFTSLGILDKVKDKFVLAKDVRQVLAYVESGDADAGMVYLTDAKTSDQVKIVATADEKSHTPILYPEAVLKASKNPAAAKAFANFLSSAEAEKVFEKYGFSFVAP